jgi:hypothetical protein
MQQDDRRAGADPLVANRRPVGRAHLAQRRPCTAGAGLTVHGPDPRPGPGPALSSVVIPPATIRHPVTGHPDGSMTRIRLQNHTLAGETQGQPLTYAMPEHGPSQERPPGGYRRGRPSDPPPGHESADRLACGGAFLPATPSGLPKDSVVNVTALVTLDKTDLDEVGQLPPTLMSDVDHGLRRVLGL